VRILFLTSRLPYPADDGGRIKTLSILEYLRPRHDLAVFCFRPQALNDEESRWANEHNVTTIPLIRGRNPLNLARSYVGGLPLSIERNRSPSMRDAVLRATGSNAFEAAFIDHWLMAQYLPADFVGLKLLHEHNAEYVMWQRQAELEPNPLLRPLVRLEARRVRSYEANVLGRFDVAFAVSEADRRALIAIGAKPSRMHILPNLPDPGLLDRPALKFADTEPVILYFGTLSWRPNIEGLEYFMGSVLPLVRKRIPEARLLIAGKGAPSGLVRLAAATEGADYLGPVRDAEELYSRARVFVETTRSGGGTKVKVLNALARGVPVVATPRAIEGLDVSPDEHLLTGADAASLADAAARLMGDAELWSRISANGRELIRNRYTAEVAYTPLQEALTGAPARA